MKPKLRILRLQSKKKQKPKSEKMETRRNWLELPDEITSKILLELGAIEIIESAQKVCTQWRKICKEPDMWRVIDFWNSGILYAMPYDLVKMAMHAIDRSCGQLIDINIEYFATDDLLIYIIHRSPQLRCLRLACCYDVSNEGLIEAVSKLPLLEEVSLSLCQFQKDALEAIARHCPLMNSFKLNYQWYKQEFPDLELDDEEEVNPDMEALLIAKNMPGLRHLMLFGNQMTDAGLQAILNGCPHLESLDLRRCFNLKLAGNLEKKLTENIKDLKRPHDSTEGYTFQPDVDHGWSGDDQSSGGFYGYDNPFSEFYDYDDDEEDDDDDDGC